MELKFYKCNHCGNLLVPAIDASVTPICCGEAMEVLVPGAIDAAVEKHVPVIERDADGKHININIGSVPHPMTEEHLIQCVALMLDDRFGIVKLNAGDEPLVRCNFDDNSVQATVYAYCNLHGLWKTEA
jgi:superoxide reductase